MNVIEPDFYAAFACIGGDCEDTCCSGMGVVIDKPTYDKYQALTDAVLLPIIQRTVIRNPTSVHPTTYGMVAFDGPSCPFLNAEKLCEIQVRLGEDYLSRTCDTYPRTFSQIDGTLERSLSLSCPEAARKILLRPGGISLLTAQIDATDKYDDFPAVDTADAHFSGKPYAHFDTVRNFCVNLLQNRAYKISERMTILGMYCDQLSRIAVEQLDAGTTLLTHSFAEHIAQRQFDSTLAGVTANAPLLLNVVINSLEDRIRAEYVSPRFLECYTLFFEGIGYQQGIETPELAANLSNAQYQYYDSYIFEREYLWENYLVSKAFKDLFPFGPQKGLYVESRTIYQEFVLLAMQFVFVRTLLVGIAGSLKHDLSDPDVVKLVQSFSRAIEHDRPYLNKTLNSLEQARITELPVLATLLKL